MDGNLKEIYESIKDQNRFTQPYWEGIQRSFAEQIDPDNFLQQPQILSTMNPLSCSEAECNIVFNNPYLPGENFYGGQIEFRDHKSANYIRQLHHVVMYEMIMKKNICDNKSAVEWGGGYGLMAALVSPLVDSYTVVDLPVFTVLQWHYLHNVFGDDYVGINDSSKRVNLVPVGMVDTVRDADMFISTWAISESSDEAMKYVLERNIFGASDILTAFQEPDAKFPYAANLEGIDELKVYKISYTPGNNFYGFV